MDLLARSTVRFGRDFCLTNVTLSVPPGELCVVLGGNGDGKSALIAALMGEGDLVSGERNLVETATVSFEEQARLIAIEAQRDDSDLTDEVFQGTPVIELLQEYCADTDFRNSLIDALDMGSILDRGFRKLSTGETRRVLLIKALAGDSGLLLLDEPYDGIDASSRPKVEHLLMDAISSRGCVMALNRVDEIPVAATQVLRLEQGRVVEHLFSEKPGELHTLMHQMVAIYDAEIRLPEPEEARTCPTNDGGSLVHLTNGKVAYTDNVVFEKLNWQVWPAEHWQVKGPNGSGKTCLLNLVTGDHPQCYVNDLELFGFHRGAGESIWQVKQHLGYVSTSLHWDYRLSVSVLNTILSGFYDSIGLYQKATEKQVTIALAWLDLLGLTAEKNTSFSKLSFGQQRCVLIARSMVKHPPLLLLDEPCLGLDEVNRALVLALIRKICEGGETSVVYVTHHEEDEIVHIGNVLNMTDFNP